VDDFVSESERMAATLAGMKKTPKITYRDLEKVIYNHNNIIAFCDNRTPLKKEHNTTKFFQRTHYVFARVCIVNDGPQYFTQSFTRRTSFAV
jgi:hypothetical protein